MADFNQTFRSAHLMEKNRLAAARIRIRFLKEQVDNLLPSKHPIAIHWANEALTEVRWLMERMHTKPITSTSPDRITESDIEMARSYPVNKLIDFSKGSAVAWCHNDRRPSLYYASRLNFASCPVCQKKFGPIDICMDRDGMTFIDAVKYLRSG